MTQRLSSKVPWRTSPRVAARGFVPTLCAMLLLASAGAVRAVGTGTLDKVSGWFESGTNVTVTATPHIYSQFDYWQGDTNGAVMVGNQISIDVSGSKSISAVFQDGITATNAVPFEWLGGLNPAWTNDFEAAVTNDADADGFTTAEEYWSGTDPLSSNSFLRIDDVLLTATNVRLIWAHAQVDTNIPPIWIQSRASLITGLWMNVDFKNPVNGTNTWAWPIGSERFYRLSVPIAP